MDKFWHAISAQSLDDNPALQIYQTNFLAARLKALEYNFPLCKAQLGDDLFSAICKHYAHSFPSNYDSLNAYGQYFPDFLKEIIPHNPALQNTGYIAQLAELDWHLIQAYFAADDCLASMNTAEDEVTKNTYIVAPSSLGLCQITHPNLIRSMPFQTLIKEGFDESENLCANLQQDSQSTHSTLRHGPDSNFVKDIKDNEELQGHANTVYLAVVRQELRIYIHLLTKDEFSLLQLIRERTPIFKLDKLGLDPKMFSQSLNSFKQKGLVIGLKESQMQDKRDAKDDTF